MRQVVTTIPGSAIALACSALLAACGGGGDGSSGGTAQSLDFPYPGARHLADAPAPLTATSSSGLAVTFSSNTPSTCTVDAAGNLVPVSAGECQVTANQSGNSEFAAALPAQQLFMVLKHAQAITFKSPGFQDISLVPAPLVASSDSGLAVTLTSDTPDVCTVSGATLTLVSRGVCSITATQPGDANYTAAPSANVSFNVGDTPPPVLTILSGFKSTSSTIEGGSVDGYAGSNMDGWWCFNSQWSPSGTPAPRCASALGTDGSFTFSYSILIDPAHPNNDGWLGAYFGAEMMAAGVGSISSTGNTTTGVQVAKQTTLKFNLGENTEWFGTIGPKDPATHNADVKVTLVLGHFALKNGGACNVAVNSTFTPTAASVQPYEMQLSGFTSFSETCGLTLNAATELQTYPIVKVKFDAVQANTTVSRTPAPNLNYPTEITLSGAVTVQ